MAKKTAIVVIYFHPEAYPPTLNAVEELSKLYDEVKILFRPHFETKWVFPSNVYLIPSGTKVDIKTQENAPIYYKMFWFLQFTFKLMQLSIKSHPKLLLLYDPIPLFCFRLIRYLISKTTRIWYHNHDVAEQKKLRKYSIGWFATKSEPKMFSYLDIFSLPAEERKIYFPMEKLKGNFIFLPNLPSKKLYSSIPVKSKLAEADTIRLIYQGNVGSGHGLECIASILVEKIEGKKLELHIAGETSPEMKSSLITIACESSNNIIFHGRIAYNDLPYITLKCDIGLAILEPKNINYTSAGSASNKIYEYAACGLPVLYYNDEHYNKSLGKYNWAFPVNIYQKEIINVLLKIIHDYPKLSKYAKDNFINELNFENGFQKMSLCLTA